MTDEEKKQKKLEARRKYDAEYRAKNREKLNSYARNWRKENPEKAKANKQAYWDRKAEELQKETEENNMDVFKRIDEMTPSERELVIAFMKADNETQNKVIEILNNSENHNRSSENK